MALSFTACPRCFTQVALGERFCPSCGANIGLEQQVMGMEPALKKARNWILGVGVMYLVTNTAYMFIKHDQLTPVGRQIMVGIGVGLFIIHLGLWLWAKKAPFAAAVTALVVFCTLHLVEAVLDPTTILQGIIVKVLFITVLVQAIKAGLEVQRIRRQHQ